ncbi:MAG: DUF5658 family protein, partial [Pseudomonadota bacterium]|nr:DUF5658 family protein [Pseudomonadota bacterium]
MLHDGYGTPCQSGVERRCGGERREYSLITVVRALYGQRVLGRRQADQIGAYVDRFGPGVLVLGLVILTLCCVDAFLSLSLINAGISDELNPLMRWAMQQSIYFFLALKIGFTTLALFVLLGLKNFYVFGRIKVSYILYGTLMAYVLLIKYEL